MRTIPSIQTEAHIRELLKFPRRYKDEAAVRVWTRCSRVINLLQAVGRMDREVAQELRRQVLPLLSNARYKWRKAQELAKKKKGTKKSGKRGSKTVAHASSTTPETATTEGASSESSPEQKSTQTSTEQPASPRRRGTKTQAQSNGDTAGQGSTKTTKESG